MRLHLPADTRSIAGRNDDNNHNMGTVSLPASHEVLVLLVDLLNYISNSIVDQSVVYAGCTC